MLRLDINNINTIYAYMVVFGGFGVCLGFTFEGFGCFWLLYYETGCALVV